MYNNMLRYLLGLIIVSMLFIPAVSVHVLRIGDTEGTDPNAVHKWETWDDDINVTGTMRTDNKVMAGLNPAADNPYWTIDPVIPQGGGFMSTASGNYIALGAVSSSNYPTAAVVSYRNGTYENGNPPLIVMRVSDTDEYNNTGSLIQALSWNNDTSLWPVISFEVNSQGWDQYDPVVRVIGNVVPDSYRGVLFVDNSAGRPAIEVANEDMVCPRLNADRLDGQHGDEFLNNTGDVTITGNLTVTDNMTATYYLGDGSYLTGISSNDTNAVHKWETWDDNLNVTNNLTVLEDLVVYGNITGGSPAKFREGILSYDNISAPYFVGNGSQLTGVNADTVDGYHMNQNVLNTSDVEFDSIYIPTGYNSHGGYEPYGIKMCDTHSSVTGCGKIYYDQYLKGTIVSGQFVYLSAYPNWVEIFSRTRVFDVVEPDNTVSNIADLGAGDRRWNEVFLGSGGVRLSNSSVITYWSMNSQGTNNDLNLFNYTSTSKLKLEQDGSLYVPGVYDDTGAVTANVYVASDGQLYRAVSSDKFKENIRNIEVDTKKLYQLRPRSYEFKSENAYQTKTGNQDRTSFGLIAEEVDNILPELVIREPKPVDIRNNNTICHLDEYEKQVCEDVITIRRDYDGYEISGVNYQLLSVLLLQEVQRMNEICKLNKLEGCVYGD